MNPRVAVIVLHAALLTRGAACVEALIADCNSTAPPSRGMIDDLPIRPANMCFQSTKTCSVAGDGAQREAELCRS